MKREDIVSIERQIRVIIPVYNSKDYLEEAVVSVLKQPYQSISIILVDDGSTDASSMLCDRLAQKYGRIEVLHQENAGVSIARNTGIEFVLQNTSSKKIENQYIAFLDADDRWKDDFFTNAFVSTLPKAQIIRFQSLCCNSMLTRCYAPASMKEGVYTGGKNMITPSLSQHFAAGLYACSLLSAHTIRFIEGLKYSEDVLFLRECIFLAETVAFFNKPLYLYRMNRLSAVHKRPVGIAYFEPIFFAYLSSIDRESGLGFVAWYMADMIDEHFLNFGTMSELKQWMTEHEDYIEIARKYGGQRFESILATLNSHPVQYMLKNYAIGGALKIFRSMIRTRYISLLAERFKYPIRLKNDNKKIQ